MDSQSEKGEPLFSSANSRSVCNVHNLSIIMIHNYVCLFVDVCRCLLCVVCLYSFLLRANPKLMGLGVIWVRFCGEDCDANKKSLSVTDVHK